ncbi:MAG: PQQ-dependent sugar dehydrogenase [Planctomycetes bacterium]|nr:PQQ-dependent sugar dehydrogenase [Planctomycetota bacterium]
MKRFIPLALAGLLGVPSPAPSQTSLDGVLFASGFSAPVYVCAPAGDQERLFVVQQGGLIRIRKNGVTLATPFLNVAPLILSGGERGLLGMAFHPNYATNGFFYIYYTRTPDGALTLARYQVSAANPDVANAASATVFLAVPHPGFSNHNGGSVQFGPDGYLYMATGDGGSGNDPSNNAQNINSLLGKMLRLDVDNAGPLTPYSAPANNPYVGIAGADEIWAIGLRNPFRFSFDRLTGDLYIGDVGQNAREEIDFQAAADFFAAPGTFPVRNYGWRCMEANLCTGLTGCTCNAAALTPPIHWYVNQPCFAVIGGAVYRGCAIPDLRGTYFLADNCSNQIWSFRYIGGVMTNFMTRTAELDPPGALAIGSIAGFGEDGCGELYICDLGGEIFKIVPATPVTTGLTPYGTGTAGCSGAHALSASTPAAIHAPCWTLTTTNAPASSVGILALADVQDLAGSDPLGVGLTLHVSLGSPLLFLLPMPSNASGTGSLTIPIPNSTALIGAILYGQTAWGWPAGPCAPSSIGASSSNGLEITIQA